MAAEHFNGFHENVDYQDNPHVVVHLNDETTDYPTHWHTPLELLMPVENTYSAFIGNRAFELKPYDILLVAPNVYHSYIAPDTGSRYFILVDTSILSDILGVSQILSLINPSVLFTASNSPKVHPTMKSLFLDICNAYAGREHLFVSPHVQSDALAPGIQDRIDLLEPVIYGKLLELLTLVARNYASAEKAEVLSRGKQQEYINKMTMVCNYIDAHCTEDLSLEQLSKMINFSKYHFSRLFKEFTHESFYRYVNKKRMQYAEQLLIQQNLSVTDTALSSGYSSTSSFIRMFKSVNGCTPREFKERRLSSLSSDPEPGTDSKD